MEAVGRETVAAIIWFMIGFGAGLAILSFWKYILAATIAAVILPVVLAIIGLPLPITPEAVVDALLYGIDRLADILSRNRYSIYGFAAGAALGLAVAAIRLQRAARSQPA